MGRRSRKARSADDEGSPPGEPVVARQPPRVSRGPGVGAPDRPVAPWHPFPLVELCTLVGIVLILVGCISLGDRRGGVLIVCGLVLGSLAGLDTVVREHFAGFRSHSLLLAGVPTVLVAGALFFARAPVYALLVAVVVVCVAAFATFRREFRRRSGGLSFR